MKTTELIIGGIVRRIEEDRYDYADVQDGVNWISLLAIPLLKYEG